MFSVKVRPMARATVFALRGELDHHSAVQLAEAADAALAGPRLQPLLVIDCADLDFCDSTGISTLVTIHQRLSARGGVLRLAAVPGSVARVFGLTGLDQAIGVFATAQRALADTRHPPTGDIPSSAPAARERQVEGR
ncbi:STAS domain-containing protein [Streptomyces griseoviridis]|uniref:STAS domain-containing protein n=1 Tax=Streptomyces griseoviridis TaxID=45398 RepID=UPI0034045FC9